ncbi:hypothetical protein ABZ845_07350 [Streptomyces sp. NPDC047022]|uniref:hypothetical protein n=1 Tax=Streptomyces sp. NPDC047022 TaxID=3155737 RepID=UPI0033F440E5
MSGIRMIWLALMLQLAVMVALIGGLISRLDGATPAHAVFVGAGAFSGTVLLLLAMASFLERR